MDIYDVIIIGSGPAGYTAALYTSRAFLSTLMLAGNEVGGQLTTTTDIENYPGFEEGIPGPRLMEIMKKQVERFGTTVLLEEVTEVDFSKPPYVIKTGGKSYRAKTVIIATGASALYLGLPSEQRLRGKGVSACATCDGFFFRDKEVVVVGGGDTAMEEATFLTRFASKVTIIHRRPEFRASAVMYKRATDNPKISFLTNKTVTEVLGDSSVIGVKLADTVTGKVSDLATQGVFLAIGHTPNTRFLKGSITLDQKGYVLTETPASALDPHTRTSIPGVYAAGDCVDPKYRQAIVAAGQGCMAALDAQQYLEEAGV
jgi:thioredoxin reductase (NADPH)